jgi:hypothetical protein
MVLHPQPSEMPNVSGMPSRNAKPAVATNPIAAAAKPPREPLNSRLILTYICVASDCRRLRAQLTALSESTSSGTWDMIVAPFLYRKLDGVHRVRTMSSGDVKEYLRA